MTTENATSMPAGAEHPAAPAGDTPSTMSIDDAVQKWTENEESEAARAAQEANTAEAALSQSEPAEAVETGDLDAADAQVPPEEVEYIDWDRISPDKKMRLRDGFEFDKRYINENIDRLRKLSEVEREVAARVQQFREAYGQHAQKEQLFAQVLPLAIANAQASVPPEPEPPVFDPSEPIDYIHKRAEYDRVVAYRNRKIEELRQLHTAQAQQAQANQQQRQVHERTYVAEQQQALFDAMPRLRDKAERQKFHAEYSQLAERLGFTPEEYGNAADHRVMLMADLAMDGLKYRKLKSEPPKPKPVNQQVQTPPLAEPGKRVAASEASASKRQELLSLARKSGGLSVDDAIRFL